MMWLLFIVIEFAIICPKIDEILVQSGFIDMQSNWNQCIFELDFHFQSEHAFQTPIQVRIYEDLETFLIDFNHNIDQTLIHW